MRVEVIPAAELTPELALEWRRVQKSDWRLQNPHFCPEFAISAGHCYPNAFVAVAEEAGRIVGFVPFQRRWGKAGRGIAPSAPLIAYQGMIMDPQARWNVPELLQGCGLSSLEYRHVPALGNAARERLHNPCISYVIDLSAGVEAYNTAHSRSNSTLRRKARLAEREIGPIRFVGDTDDSRVFAGLMAMKRRQCIERGWDDPFAERSLREMVERLQSFRTPEFAGLLSALYFGDQLAAAQFSFRSSTVMHVLFLAYDNALSRYSPGALQFQRLIDAASSLGFAKIDLGYGNEEYKPRMANDQVMVGDVLLGSSLPVKLRTCSKAIRRQIRETALGPQLLNARDSVRRRYRELRCRLGLRSAPGPSASPPPPQTPAEVR